MEQSSPPRPQHSTKVKRRYHHQAHTSQTPAPLNDIEDMIRIDEWGQDFLRRPNRPAMVIPRFVGKSRRRAAPTTTACPHVPGTQRLWVKTFGCSHNVSDSEYMEGMLSEYGYELLPEEEKEAADLWLINSCTVKNPSQAAFVNLIQKGKSAGKSVVVAGCVPQGNRHMNEIDGLSVLGLAQLERVVEVVEQTLQGNTVRLLSKAPLPRLDLPKIRRNKMIEIIPLSTGCLGACTYCKTRHARGKLGSYNVKSILERAKSVLKDGVTEIWLSSEDTGAYGRDLGGADNLLPALLSGLTTLLPAGVMLRIGMTNPPFILDQLEPIALALSHPNVFAFLHVPLQSGSNRVLKAMNREYIVEEFCIVVDTLLGAVPGVTIATDIICGFPGETEEDFQETMDLLERYKLPVVNISQFYPRPGTPAAKMRRVPTDIVKDRSRRLTRMFESWQPYKGMEGQILKVWINTEVTPDGAHVVGHTKSYIKVLIPHDPNLIGAEATVIITATSRFHVVSEMLTYEKIRRDLGDYDGGVILNTDHRRQMKKHRLSEEEDLERAVEEPEAATVAGLVVDETTRTSPQPQDGDSLLASAKASLALLSVTFDDSEGQGRSSVLPHAGYNSISRDTSYFTAPDVGSLIKKHSGSNTSSSTSSRTPRDDGRKEEGMIWLPRTDPGPFRSSSTLASRAVERTKATTPPPLQNNPTNSSNSSRSSSSNSSSNSSSSSSSSSSTTINAAAPPSTVTFSTVATTSGGGNRPPSSTGGGIDRLSRMRSLFSSLPSRKTAPATAATTTAATTTTTAAAATSSCGTTAAICSLAGICAGNCASQQMTRQDSADSGSLSVSDQGRMESSFCSINDGGEGSMDSPTTSGVQQRERRGWHPGPFSTPIWVSVWTKKEHEYLSVSFWILLLVLCFIFTWLGQSAGDLVGW